MLWLTILITAATAQSCSRQLIRREWHDLTRAQQERWATCVRTLYDDGQWIQFQDLHAQMRVAGHGRSFFLQFHRLFLYYVEQAVAAAGCGDIGMPYLDSSAIYNRASEDSAWEVLDTLNGCTEGVYFGGMETSSGTCIQRASDGRTMYPSAVIKSLIDDSATFEAFASSCEAGQHAQFHNFVGGCMSNLNCAAADPVFMLHHAFVDFQYASWQNVSEERYYDVGNQDPDATAEPWDSFTIRQIADYRNTLCYSYGNPSAVVGGPPPAEETPNVSDGDDDDDDDGDADQDGDDDDTFM